MDFEITYECKLCKGDMSGGSGISFFQIKMGILIFAQIVEII